VAPDNLAAKPLLLVLIKESFKKLSLLGTEKNRRSAISTECEEQFMGKEP
jgi:hypothetical protein